MCGYCTESIIFRLLSQRDLEKIATSPDLRFALTGYLQESPNLPAVLERCTSEQLHHHVVQKVIVCRGIETLVIAGFESGSYQSLLANERYIGAIRGHCGASATSSRNSLPINTSPFSWLDEQDIYTRPELMATRLSNISIDAIEQLLDQYGRHFLEQWPHISVKNGAENVLPPTHWGQRASNEPHEEMPHNHFPKIWFALLWLAKNCYAHETIWRVASTDIAGVPQFHSFGLWLQRRAALLAYDTWGIEPFLRKLPRLRAELFQYLAIQRPISPRECARLTKKIARLPGADHYGHTFSMRRWLVDNDLQLA